MHIKRFFCLVSLFIFTLACLAASSGLDKTVTWGGLAKHMADDLIPVTKLKVVDCPVDGLGQPSRTVMQWIENTFYRWNEYEQKNGRFYVEMIKPVSEKLSQKQAQVLLSASQQWMQQQAPLKTARTVVSPDDPSLKAQPKRLSAETRAKLKTRSQDRKATPWQRMPVYSEPLKDGQTATAKTTGSLQPVNLDAVVLGDDDRTSGHDTTAYPFNAVCYLTATHSGTPYRATAFLVNPYVALTAGQVVFDLDGEQFAEEVMIYPGQYENEGSVIRPYGGYSAHHIATTGNVYYLFDEWWGNNVGAVFLSEAVSGISTFAPVVFDYYLPDGRTIKSAGYPDTVSGNATFDQWLGTGIVEDIWYSYLDHSIDTNEGSSDGSPIYYQYGDLYRTVAVQGMEGWEGGVNYASFFEEYNQGAVETWMTWNPVLGQWEEDAYEENDTMESAYDLNNSAWYWLDEDKGEGVLYDEDWFKYTMSQNAKMSNIHLRFEHDLGDIDVELYNSLGDLVASSVSTEDTEFISVPTPPGTYYIRVFFSNKGNRYNLVWYSSTDTTLPNLSTAWLYSDKSYYSPNEEINLSLVVENSGGEITPTTNLNYRISEDTTIDDSDPIITTTIIPSLSPQSGFKDYVTINAPAVNGGYYIAAVLEPVPNELSTTDNRELMLIQVGDPPADLEIIAFSTTSTSSIAGSPVEFKVVIQNIGVAASTETNLNLHVNTSNQVDQNALVGATTIIESLAPGDIVVKTLSFTTNETGYLYFKPHVEPVPNETVTDNNLWSWTRAFNFSPGTPPNAPTPIAPVANTGETRPVFTWSHDSSYTREYQLWVNDVTGNRFKTWLTSREANCSESNGQCSFKLNLDLAYGNVTWWIRGKNDVGIGPYNAGKTFTVGDFLPPGKPTAIAPYGVITDPTPSYTWKAVENATWYYLWVNDNGGNARVKKWYKAQDANCPDGSGDCNVEPSMELVDGHGKWWVHGFNANGNGPWSSGLAFEFRQSAPGSTTLVSPVGTTETTPTPTYTWQALANATWYNLQITAPNGGQFNKWYSAAGADCLNGSGNCSVTPDNSLTNGNAIWRVTGWNNSGSGNWSTWAGFTVASPTDAPDAAPLVSPNGDVATITPTYRWEAVPGADAYYLWVNDNEGNKVQTWYTSVEADCADGYCEVTPNVPVNGVNVMWWVRTRNEADLGPWSDGMSFSTDNPYARFAAGPVDLNLMNVTLSSGKTHPEAYTQGFVLTVEAAVSGNSDDALIDARLLVYDGDVLLAEFTPNGDLPSLHRVSGGRVALDFLLPAQKPSPNMSFVLELDPHDTILEGDETNNRFPETGRQKFDFFTSEPGQ